MIPTSSRRGPRIKFIVGKDTRTVQGGETTKSEQSCCKGKGAVSEEIDSDEEENSNDHFAEEEDSVEAHSNREEDSKGEQES